jgi:hypothetical protein
VAHPEVVIVDADTVAGWRRATPSFVQLRDALADLARQAPDATVAVLGDPALKWALSSEDQVLLDEEINHQRIVLAPAGTVRGHVRFIERAVGQATRTGTSVVVVTDRAIQDCRIARLSREGDRFVFDLEGATVTSTSPVAPVHRHRRRGRS